MATPKWKDPFKLSDAGLAAKGAVNNNVGKTYTPSAQTQSYYNMLNNNLANKPQGYTGSRYAAPRDQLIGKINSFGDFKLSDDTLGLKAKLNGMMDGYGEKWNGGKYGTAMENALNDLLNQKKFSYDLNGDALYNQYKDQYMRQGAQAMADTMGQAAQLNGGYGTSYSQMAGQQAYNQQIDQLNDRIPELYNLAMQAYQLDQNRLNGRYGALANAYGLDYGEYRDRAADWYGNRDFLAGEVDRRSNWEKGLYDDQIENLYKRLGMLNDADKMVYDRAMKDYENWQKDTSMYGDMAQKENQLGLNMYNSNIDNAIKLFNSINGQEYGLYEGNWDRGNTTEQQGIKNNQSQQTIDENKRHNQATEGQAQQNIDEDKRHNQVTENQSQQSINENKRHNQANENIDQQKANNTTGGGGSGNSGTATGGGSLPVTGSNNNGDYEYNSATEVEKDPHYSKVLNGAKTEEDVYKILKGMVNNGTISEDVADKLYDKYTIGK